MDQQEDHGQRRPKRLSVRRTGASLIKDEFNSLRARFDAEMRQMEAGMTRFRSQMERSSLGREVSSDGITRTTTTTKSTRSTRTSKFTAKPGQPDTDGDGGNCPQDWLSEFAQSPIVVSSTGEGGGRERSLKLRFDVSTYKPDEIVVKTLDDRLQVEARHEQADEQEFVSSEYHREFLLPDGVDHEQIRSSLSLEGILTVEVPLAGN